jgi:hypothetical protein
MFGRAEPQRPLTLLGLFLACYVALILKWEDFAYSDNNIFTLFTLKGHDLDPRSGRVIDAFFRLTYGTGTCRAVARLRSDDHEDHGHLMHL